MMQPFTTIENKKNSFFLLKFQRFWTWKKRRQWKARLRNVGENVAKLLDLLWKIHRKFATAIKAINRFRKCWHSFHALPSYNPSPSTLSPKHSTDFNRRTLEKVRIIEIRFTPTIEIVSKSNVIRASRPIVNWIPCNMGV